MEIKINVTSSEEDRKNVELFEFRRRKEEEFKHKIEEQMDSLISQNEKEKSSIKDEIRKLEDEIRKLENKIDERINHLNDFLSREIRHDFRQLVLYLSMKADGRTYFPNCGYIDKTFNGLEKRYEKEVFQYGA